MIPERVYYSDNMVQVSNSQIRLGQTLYATSDVSAAKLKLKLPDNAPRWRNYALLCSLVLIVVIGVLVLILRISGGDEQNVAIMYLFFVQALFAAIALILLIQLRYAIELKGTFGKRDVFLWKDIGYLYGKEIVNAINAAISSSSAANHSQHTQS